MLTFNPSPDQTPKNLHNPLSRDFTFTYANEDGKGKTEYILKSQHITTLPTWLADKILKQLADEVYWQRFGPDNIYMVEIEKIKKELVK